LVILNALSGKLLPIYGNGSNIRDWLYVEDHADALILLATKGKVGKSYNIGGENECSNLQLVKTICSILDRMQPRDIGNYADLITFVTDRPGHDERYSIDSSFIQKELGWKPRVSLEDGLERTVRWYIENEDWWCPILARQRVSKRLGKLK
jgi:dTDP-glucose 4,6-dehydratase